MNTINLDNKLYKSFDKRKFSENFNKEFLKKFCGEEFDMYDIYDTLDTLIEKLSPETGKPWNVISLLSYIEIIYKRAHDLNSNITDVESSTNVKLSTNVPHNKKKNIYIYQLWDQFTIINTSLLGKDNKDIYALGDKIKHFCKFGNLDDINKELRSVNLQETTIARVTFHDSNSPQYLYDDIKIKLPVVYDNPLIKLQLETRSSLLNMLINEDKFPGFGELFDNIENLKREGLKNIKNMGIKEKEEFFIDEMDSMVQQIVLDFLKKYTEDKSIINSSYLSELLNNKVKKIDDMGKFIEIINLENKYKEIKAKDSENVNLNKYDVYNNIIKIPDKNRTFTFRSTNHIVIDGSDNLPFSFLNDFLGISDRDLDKFQIQFKIIGEGNNCMSVLRNIINRAIEMMLSRFKSDRSLIAPIYYVKSTGLSYLLPLYITHGEKPDCALLFNKEGNKYVAKTLLNMEEAYMDVRLLGTVDMYPWLQ